jgi:hypothetical protein
VIGQAEVRLWLNNAIALIEKDVEDSRCDRHHPK